MDLVIDHQHAEEVQYIPDKLQLKGSDIWNTTSGKIKFFMQLDWSVLYFKAFTRTIR